MYDGTAFEDVAHTLADADRPDRDTVRSLWHICAQGGYLTVP